MRPGYYPGLDVLRIVAALVVFYDHARDWFTSGAQRWWFDDVFTSGVVEPLALGDHLGPLAISTFFVVSGFVITNAAFRESPGRFLARRAMRIVPALWVVLLIIWFVARAGIPIAVTGTADTSTLLTNLTLTNLFFSGEPALDAVTWSLVVQVVYYLYVAVTIPLLRRWPWLPSILAVALAGVLLSVVRAEVPVAAHTVRVVVTFLPILFIGQLIALVRLGKLHPLAGTAYGVLHWLLLVRGDLTSYFTPAVPGYPQSVVCIALLVIVCTRISGGEVAGRWVRAVANRTYAVYLVHVPVLYVTPHLLSTSAGTTLAFLTVVAGTAVTADLLHRVVEVPAVRLFRRWENRGQYTAERAPDDVAGRAEATR